MDEQKCLMNQFWRLFMIIHEFLLHFQITGKVDFAFTAL